MTMTQPSILIVSQAVSARRRAMGAESPAKFAATYLGHHFRDPPSRMHNEVFDLLERMTDKNHRRQRVAIAAPRGHAKTTLVSLAYVLWCLLYRIEMFILILSATREQAEQLLTEIVREIKENARLIEDFPEICQPVINGRKSSSPTSPGAKIAFKDAFGQASGGAIGGGGGGVRVKGNHLVIPNGACVRVLGTGQGMRGMKHGRDRPTLIIGDDLEELEATLSGDQRDKTREWFQKTLMKAGGPETNVVVIGTILHYDSLLANLTSPTPRRDKAGGWDGRVYRAVETWSPRSDLWDRWESVRFGEEDFEGCSGVKASGRFLEAHRDAMLEGTQVLWPDRESYTNLMEIRADEGRSSFQSEKQNEPLDPEKCLFREESIRYWDDPKHPRSNGEGFVDAEDLIATLGSRRVYTYGACDPSLGERGRGGDYSAVITLVRDGKSGVMYVVDAHIAQHSPEALIETIVSLNRTYEYDSFAVETNLHRGLLADQLEKRARHRGRGLRIERVENTRNKIARIQGIEPLVTRGKVRFSRKHQRLLEQLRQFPMGDHDDGPDALQMAIEIAEDSGPTCVIQDR